MMPGDGRHMRIRFRAFPPMVFRHMLVESGRLHLPVHLHSSAGAGDYFSVAGVSVLNLEPLAIARGYLHDNAAGLYAIAPAGVR